MKCQKCNYISFDHNESCPKCKKDLSEIRAKLGFPSYCPLLPTNLGVQPEPSAGSIKIEQTSDVKSGSTTETPFADPQDFESSFEFDSPQNDEESDLDFSLADDSGDLTLDFDDFASDNSEESSSQNDLENEIAGSFEDDLDLAFDDADTTLDFEDISSEGAPEDQETIVASSLEDELNLSFDDTSETTMDFEELSSDTPDESTLDFEDLSSDESGESTLDFEDLSGDGLEMSDSLAEDKTIAIGSLDDELDLSFDNDEEVPSSSIEAAERDVDDLRLNFEDSISMDESDKKDSSELEVLDLDLDLDDK